MADTIQLPDTIALEKGILARALTDRNVLLVMMRTLKEQHFSDPHTLVTFKAISYFFSKGNDVDVLLVASALSKRNKEINWAYELSVWDNGMYGMFPENICGIILKGYLEKQGILSADAFQKALVKGEDVTEIYDQHIKSLLDLQSSQYAKQSQAVGDIAKENMEQIRKVNSGEISLIGCKTDILAIDRVLLGLRAPDLLILAARPGMGKTAFALTLARNIAVARREPCAFFSLEMSSNQLGFRLQSMGTGISYNNLCRGSLHENEMLRLERANDLLGQAKLFIDDTGALSPVQMRSKAIDLVARHGVKTIFVDYLQLMKVEGHKGNRETEVSEISRSLKALAKELNVPIVALSQLSRKSEDRGDKRPGLTDLRESGSIEQDADVVMFLYRPEYYKIHNDENGNALPEGYTELSFSKNRNGAANIAVPLRFRAETMTFEDMSFEPNF